MVPYAAMIQAGLGLGQMIMSANQTANRPEYKPPRAIIEAKNIAEREANATLMPGQAQMQNQIQANSANSISHLQKASKSTADIINGVGAIQAQENRSLTDLYLQSLSYKDRARNRQMQALSGLANAQNQAWEYNQQQPYEYAMASKSALLGAGLQTSMDAVAGIGAHMQQQAKGPAVKPPLGSIYDLPVNGSLYSNIV